MAGPAIIRAAVRKRGNPYWGCLCLNADVYVSSAELRRWCWQNRNRFYIPEWLLQEWRIPVDPNITDAAQPSRGPQSKNCISIS